MKLKKNDLIIYKFAGRRGYAYIEGVTERYLVVLPLDFEYGTRMFLMHENIIARVTKVKGGKEQ